MVMDGTAACGRKQHTILVVDDDVDARIAYAGLLSARGYSVVVACDGREAVDLLAEGLRPSVIVLDLNMPTMDGWTFLRHLRRTARSAIPVVVTSGDVQERPAMGEDAWLEKPVEPHRFYAIVARLSADASANRRVSGFRDT
jgi:two-component system chemotaxis response regulator CheY